MVASYLSLGHRHTLSTSYTVLDRNRNEGSQFTLRWVTAYYNRSSCFAFVYNGDAQQRTVVVVGSGRTHEENERVTGSGGAYSGGSEGEKVIYVNGEHLCRQFVWVTRLRSVHLKICIFLPLFYENGGDADDVVVR